ncbi:MAG: hypothetical protein H0T76_06510 [Nannocystis sp.]|nr:hypothetical protein [Nannocystis sp.]MBA3546114.1 hypothetical protein [Nannocystis sp.]
MQFSISKTGRLATLFGFLSSVALGCVISLGDGGKSSSECPDKNSKLDKDKSECFCNFGYSWCFPNDNSDLSCCESPTTAATISDTNNTGGTSATDDTATATGGTTSDSATGTTTDEPPTTSVGTTGEPLECSSTAVIPRSCDPDVANFLCVQADNPDCGPEGSKYYVCDGGTWAQNPTGPTGNCISDGYDFGYGCLDGDPIEFVCGDGPGTACSGDATSCNGDNELNFCVYGKLGAEDCLVKCMDIGDGGGVTYDFGYCGDQGSGSECICCDEGEDGCPLGGETSGGGESSSG